MRRSVRKTENQEDGVKENIVNNRTMRIGVIGLCLGVALSVSVVLCVEPPAVEWTRVYTELGQAQGHWVEQTADHGYVVAAQQKPDSGLWDFLLVKTDSTGATQWQRSFGAGPVAIPASVALTSDGGYVMAGSRQMSDGTGGYIGGAYVVRVDSLGGVRWERTFWNDSLAQSAFSVVATTDGGYVFTGFEDKEDEYLAKLDSEGSLIWKRNLSGGYGMASYPLYWPGNLPLQPTANGGFIMGGRKGSLGFRLIRTDSVGDLLWDRTYSCADLGAGSRSIRQTSDGGYVVTGTGLLPGDEDRRGDIYLLRTDSLGNCRWIRTYGGDRRDLGMSLSVCADGGFVVAGFTDSIAPDHLAGYVVRTDSTGGLTWQYAIGFSDYQTVLESIRQTSDGGFVLVGARQPIGTYERQMLLQKLQPETGR
jgi:hypothetical protein